MQSGRVTGLTVESRSRVICHGAASETEQTVVVVTQDAKTWEESHGCLGQRLTGPSMLLPEFLPVTRGQAT